MPEPSVPRRLDPRASAALFIDIQAKLLPAIEQKATLVRRSARLAQGFTALGLPVLATEHQPRLLGGTIGDIKKHLDPLAAYEEKSRLSSCVGRIDQYLAEHGVRSVVLTGVETHAAVLATALDLIDKGYAVAVCFDAVGARRSIDHESALHRMTQAGVLPVTVESALLELCDDPADTRFRALVEVLRSPDARE